MTMDMLKPNVGSINGQLSDGSWTIGNQGTFFSINPSGQEGEYYLADNGNTVYVQNGTGGAWYLIPVTTPSSEIAQQQAGLPGYTFCADGDAGQSCNFTGSGSLIYGANGEFRTLSNLNFNNPLCQLSTFGTDPTPNVHKACFYAPYDPTISLPTNGTTISIGEGGTLKNPNRTAMSVIYSGTDPSTGAPYGTYTVLGQSASMPWNVGSFGEDPAFGINKTCYATVSPSATFSLPNSVPSDQSGWAYCGVYTSSTGTVDVPSPEPPLWPMSPLRVQP